MSNQEKVYECRKNRTLKIEMPKTRKQRGGAATPTTSWGNWGAYPGALAWSANTQAPLPLANGGLYSAPQSTGAWASQPFPATQYAWAIESARVSGLPEVFYHQRPNDNNGASFSPQVGIPLSPLHSSIGIPPKVGGSRKSKRKAKRRGSKTNRRR